QILTAPHHTLGAQAGRLIGAGVPRQKVAIIYDVGLSTLYRKSGLQTGLNMRT
ncbi:TPA: helix-turn-helix domain-containing protein, partial [Salmonella enterica]|nr:helix-turn-helix domain-containing protein [Salmonella enterica]